MTRDVSYMLSLFIMFNTIRSKESLEKFVLFVDIAAAHEHSP